MPSFSWGIEDAPSVERILLRSLTGRLTLDPSFALQRVWWMHGSSLRRLFHVAGLEIQLVRRLIVEALMRPRCIVEAEVARQRRFTSRGVA